MAVMKSSLAIALCLLPAALAADGASLGISSPLLVWSSRDVFGQGKHVSYQVFPKVEEVASDVVLSALGKAADSISAQLNGLTAESIGEGERRTVVLFIGSQLDAADMRTDSSAVRDLNVMLSGASSSLAMPYAISEGASIRESVCSKLDASGITHEVVGCSASSTDLHADVSAVLDKAGDAKPQVLIVCSNVDPALENMNAGLEIEIEQLKAVQAAVQAAGVNDVIAYASQTTLQVTADNGKRRSLLATYTGFGSYQVCGTLCQTQVRWLEGMLAMLVLALASCAGLVCLYVLDTPTRFESVKEAAPQQS